MTYETIDVRKTTPTIGAEIFGVDLSRPLTNRQFDEIHQALLDNLVIFFAIKSSRSNSTWRSVPGSASCISIRMHLILLRHNF